MEVRPVNSSTIRWDGLVVAHHLSESEVQVLREALATHAPGQKPRFVHLGDQPPSIAVDLFLYSAAQLETYPLLLEARAGGIPVVDVEVALADIRGVIPADPQRLRPFLAIQGAHPRWLRPYLLAKRALSMPLALALLFLFMPFLLAIGALIYLREGGPVLYSQRRSGYRGKIFNVYKFRTMRTDAEEAGPQWSSDDDSRVTRLGAFLRRSHLDELPQLWNVVKGEMELVGPRPERPEYYALLAKEIPLFHLRLLARPGITGWAQVTQGYASSVDQSRRKLEADLYYLLYRSPAMDAWILFRTAGKVFARGSRGSQTAGANPQPKSPHNDAVPSSK